MKRNLLVVGALACAVACASRPPPPSQQARPLPALVKVEAPTPRPLEAGEIDRFIGDAASKAGVTPAGGVDDATFLRRVHIDVAGAIPTAEEVTAFLADKAPDKRKRAVERLLASPRYADHFTNYWDRVLLGRDARPGLVDRMAFRSWLHDQFEKNVPYDKLAYALLTATGENSAGGNPRKPETRPPPDGAPVNGAVNWFLRYADTPMDLAGTTSRVFLGVQIQCAQCHDHKSENWKTTDFESFTSCFLRTRFDPIDRGKVVGVRRVEVKDSDLPRKMPKRMDMPAFANARRARWPSTPRRCA